MKDKGAGVFVKQIISVVSNCVAKAKCMAVIRNKSDAMKTKLMITALTVMSKKKTISAKIHDAIDHGVMIFKQNKHEKEEEENEVERNKLAIVLYGGAQYEGEDDDGYSYKYPDLRHSLFDEENQELEDLLAAGVDPNNIANESSVIDQCKNSKVNFNLEDEIDEKLLSFKRYQQMLERSA
ncbi:hypothetical protein ACJIZ3_004662 [Penstemon smallii]|uniref:Uncharacterized protein n=1 Tax=Penstemon smallii TaxID=265156 RepID=A0ABD3S2S2_9LAMI